MNNIEDTLRICPNYTRVLNFTNVEADQITLKLIQVYKRFIEENKNKEQLKELDYVFGRYIDDQEFRRELKYQITKVKIRKSTKDIIKSIVDSILHIFRNYLENSTRAVRIARWI